MCAKDDRIAELEAALRRALPYVQSIASRQPTTQANMERCRRALQDARAIRDALETETE